MKRSFTLVCCLLSSLCFACNDAETTGSQSTPTTASDSGQDTTMTQMQTLTGTLVYQTQEGGFLGFITDSGDHYMLRGLDKGLRQNGMKLSVKGEVRNDIMTTRQFGKVFEVTEVVSSDDKDVKPASNEM